MDQMFFFTLRGIDSYKTISLLNSPDKNSRLKQYWLQSLQFQVPGNLLILLCEQMSVHVACSTVDADSTSFNPCANTNEWLMLQHLLWTVVCCCGWKLFPVWKSRNRKILNQYQCDIKLILISKCTNSCLADLLHGQHIGLISFSLH